MAQQPLKCQCLIIIGAHYTQKHHTWYESSARVISPRQRLVPNNTQHLQETNTPSSRLYLPDSPSKWAAACPRLTPRDHWDGIYKPHTPSHYGTYAPENLKFLRSKFSTGFWTLLNVHSQINFTCFFIV